MDWNFISSLHSTIRDLPLPALIAGGSEGSDCPQDGVSRASTGVDRPLRAVIIEDELFAAWFIEGLLEKLGHEVTDIYSTGEEALAGNFAAVDLVIVDINLGHGMDGIEAAAALRNSYQVPIVFCSAYSDEDTRARITKTVPTATFVNKPLSERDLRAAIEGALGTKH